MSFQTPEHSTVAPSAYLASSLVMLANISTDESPAVIALTTSGVEGIVLGVNDNATQASNCPKYCDDGASNNTSPGCPEVPVGNFGLLHQQPENGGQRVSGRPETQSTNESKKICRRQANTSL